MKKAPLYLFFLLLVAHSYSFAVELPVRSIYLGGMAEQEYHKTFFMDSFRAEALRMDIAVADYREDAAFTFWFYVQSHADEQDPRIQYIIQVSLYNNETGAELVSFGWTFAELNDMLEQNEFLFYTAVALIPGIVREEAVVRYVPRYVPVRDDGWQHKWLYLRVSVDYPIAFHALQPAGLHAGAAVYGPPGVTYPNIPFHFQRLDNLIFPRPGITLGLEVQFHSHVSAELNFQINWGDPETNFFTGTAAGIRLMSILRTQTFMLQPYAAFLYTLNFSPQFNRFPSIALGAGLQVAVRAPPGNGAFFLDLNYMHFLGTIHRYNPYSTLTPYPHLIHYRHFVFGIGIGYKFGLFSRRR